MQSENNRSVFVRSFAPLFACGVFACAGVPLTLQAATVTSKMGDNNSYSKLSWACDGGNSGKPYWSDGKAPSPENDYVEQHLGRLLPNSRTFSGKSLVYRAALWSKTDGDFTFNCPVTFEKGYFGNWGQGKDSAGTLNIKVPNHDITFTSPVSDPWDAYPAENIGLSDDVAHTYLIAQHIKAASGVGVRIRKHSNPVPNVAAQYYHLHYQADCSQFYGTVDICSCGRFYFDGTTPDFPAALQVRSGGRLTVTQAMNSRSLTMEDGSLVRIASPSAEVTLDTLAYDGGRFEVKPDVQTGTYPTITAKAFTFKAGSKVRFDLAGLDNPKTAVVATKPLLKVPVESGLTADDVEIGTVKTVLHCYRVQTDDAEGVRSFTVVAYPLVTQEADDLVGKTCFTDKGAHAGDQDVWSDKRFPHADADYYSARTIRTATENNLVSHFAGHQLTLAGNLTLKSEADCPRMRIYNPDNTANPVSFNSCGLLTNRVFGGTIELVNPLRLYGANWGSVNSQIPRYNVIASELCGSGQLQVQTYGGNPTDDPQSQPSYFELAHANPNFSGNIWISAYSGSPASNERQTGILVIRDPLALGRMTTYNTYSLSIEQWGALRTCATMTLDDANRGIAVYKGRFIVDEGTTLTIKNRVTMKGTFKKLGGGTLSLGGLLCFDNGGTTTPPAGTTSNKLVVAEGALKPVYTNSLNGLEITFKPGTALELDAATADAPTRQYGLLNVKWHTPFVFASAQDKIHVRIRGAVPKGQPKTLGICTVPAAFPDMSERFTLETDGDLLTSVVKTQNPNGTVTYSAKIGRGMAVLLR